MSLADRHLSHRVAAEYGTGGRFGWQSAYVDIPRIVRETIRNIGYTRDKYGFDADTCGVIICIDEQSGDIALGVDKAKEAKEFGNEETEENLLGTGDQGMMFGYATSGKGRS